MAIDVCSETSSSPIISPRISFSHDLKEAEFIPVESDSTMLLTNPTIDFDFCFHQTFSQHLSSADEIFSNGKILPYEIKKITPQKETHHSVPISPNNEPTKAKITENPKKSPKKKRLIEFLSSNYDSNEDEKPAPKPFWQIRRSSSLNCDNGSRGNNGILRSLQFLTRSNSTGSAPNQKPKAIQKQRSLKEESIYSTNGSSVQPFNNHNWPYDKNSKRPSPYLKKSASKSFRVSPVLNIPPSCIGRGTVSLFGIASLFSGKNSKKKKKK